METNIIDIIGIILVIVDAIVCNIYFNHKPWLLWLIYLPTAIAIIGLTLYFNDPKPSDIEKGKAATYERIEIFQGDTVRTYHPRWIHDKLK